MLRTGQSPAPSQGRSTSASTPGSHPTPGVLLPGTLASPRTGLAPAGCRELVARLRRGALLSVVLGARATGRTFLQNHGVPKRWKVIAVTAVWLRQLGDCALCALGCRATGTRRGGTRTPSRGLCCG